MASQVLFPMEGSSAARVDARSNDSSVVAETLEDTAEEHSLTDVHTFAGQVMLPVMSAAMIAIVGTTAVHHCKACRIVNWIPESAVYMVVGMILGTVFESVMEDFDPEVFTAINSILLNLVLLPVIIFESGWDLRTKDFMSQFVYIVIFAVIGTLISTFVIAGLMILTGKPELEVPRSTFVRLCFCYASLISAVDPVASLATYSSLRVEPVLNTIVFGESTINDAVAISLFRAFNQGSFWRDYTTPSALGWRIFATVCTLLFGSMLLALGVASVSVLIIRLTRLGHYPNSCIIFVLASAFLTFSLAEGVCGLSGIVSVLFASMFMGIYARQHFTVAGGVLASFYLKASSAIADMTVFLFGGVIIAVNFKARVADFYIALYCVIARFAAVYPLGAVCNLLKKMHAMRYELERQDTHYLTCRHLFAMCWAGLRGGIALALVLELGPWVPEEARAMLQQATFYLVFAFLIIFGGTTQCVLTCCKIPMGEATSPDALWKTSAPPLAAFTIRWINDRIFVPVLVGHPAHTLRERDRKRRAEARGEEESRDTEIEKTLDAYDVLGHMPTQELLAQSEAPPVDRPNTTIDQDLLAQGEAPTVDQSNNSHRSSSSSSDGGGATA
eukprot:TRINITY_DN44842_c0_g1_i1.p1 TRINITY_DN44842_c0_g1~~TRINITY_DN44842_c0_g1_i1.p1  ORF type:complete len:649 (+),score=78.99 TRINITY_DN44842_c0_g1_i1:101-1948(+)